MTARTHDIIAFAALVTAAGYYTPTGLHVTTVFLAVVGNVVGALLPDIDQGTNRLWDLLPGGNYVGRVFRKAFIGHRTITHSLLGAFLTYKLFDFVLPRILNVGYVDIPIVFAAIMIGYFSHLVADALTKDGIPLLFPLPMKFGFPPIRAMRITTGKWIENLIVFPGTVIYIMWYISQYSQSLLKVFKTLS